MTIRIIKDLGFIESVTDYVTTKANCNLTLSHLTETIRKANRAYLIHDNGYECDILKGAY